MITKVYFENFRGQTETYNLGDKTIITGPNGSGKSTIYKAIELALFGYCRDDDIGAAANYVFEHYCSSSTEAQAEMSVGFETDDGTTLSRSYKKDKHGKINSTIRLNDKKELINNDFCKLTGLQIFNIKEFWSLPDNKKIDILCKLCSIDPELLKKIDDELSTVNAKKKDTDLLLKQAKNAMRELKAEAQKLSTEDEKDFSQKDYRIDELSGQLHKLETDIRESERRNSLIDSNKLRAENLSKELFELNDTQIEKPQEAVKAKDLEDCQKFIDEMDEQEESLRQRKFLQEKLEVIEGDMIRPSPSAYGADTLRAIEIEIDNIIVTGGMASELDYKVKGFAVELSEKIKDIADFFVQNDDLIEFRKRVRIAIKEMAMPYCNRITADKDGIEAQEKIEKLQKEKLRQTKIVDSYEDELRAHTIKQEQITDINNQLSDMPEYPDYSEKLHIEMKEQSLKLKMNADLLQQYEASMESRKQKIETLTDELSKLSEEIKEPEDIEFLKTRQTELLTEKKGLEDSVRADERYKTIKDEADKMENKTGMYEGELKTLKAREKKLQSQKAELLNELQERIEDKANRITHPATIGIDVRGGKNSAIKFWLNQPGGRRVTRQSASGAEQTEYDIALSSALLENNGIVIAELSELEKSRCDSLVNKTSKINNVQIMFIRHSLQHYKETENLSFINTLK